jgi:hypothetical protein
MARHFDATDYGSQAVSALTRPCTIAMLAFSDGSTGSEQFIFSHDAAANGGFRLSLVGMKLTLTFGGVAVYTFSTLTENAGGWNLYACVIPADSGTATGYLGAMGATPTSETAAVGAMSGTPNQISVGDLTWFSSGYLGDLAEVAVWDNCTLTLAELTALADGTAPSLIRPASLAHYWPLWGRHSPELNLVGGTGLTLSGPPVFTEHPRVVYPARRRMVYVPAAAGATAPPKRLMLMGCGM